MDTVTVDVPDWIVGDGEFGPVTVGDIVVVGLALLAPELLEARTSTEVVEERVVVEGDLVTETTSEGRRLPPVVRSPALTVCLLEPLDSVDDGPTRLAGRLAVEPFHWAMPGALWERFPDGVRPWRVQGVRTIDGRVVDAIRPVEDGGAETSYLVDLHAVRGSAASAPQTGRTDRGT